MNPFTQFLVKPLTHHRFVRFIKLWDTVEHFVIQTYKEEGNISADASSWRKLREKLLKEYPRWAELLRPFWQKALLNGKPATQDPFLFLLSYQEATEFRQNWGAMQILPLAREAINRLLLELQGGHE